MQNKTAESRLSDLQIIIWLTKALVMRGHQRSQAMILFVSTRNVLIQGHQRSHTTFLFVSTSTKDTSDNSVLEVQAR